MEQVVLKDESINFLPALFPFIFYSHVSNFMIRLIA